MQVVELHQVDIDAAKALLADATSADGVEPFGEAFIRALSDDNFGHRHFAVLADDGSYAALAGVAPDAIELTVAPGQRRQGIGSAILAEIDREVGERLPVWAHGNVAGAGELAEASGRAVTRELLQMSAPAAALNKAIARNKVRDDVEALDYPSAVSRWGAAAVDAAWLRVNNEAFDWHPEQGGWEQDQLDRARQADWFDPAGVFFAADVSGEYADQTANDIVGFHWTKWHGAAADGHSVGEVYVIGLLKRAQGRGLGGWLTDVGLAHLCKKGADEVILYVEGDNHAAVATYQRADFEVSRKDVQYS